MSQDDNSQVHDGEPLEDGEVDEEVMSLVTAWWLMTSSSKLLQHSLDGLEVTRGIALSLTSDST